MPGIQADSSFVGMTVMDVGMIGLNAGMTFSKH
jgi:hypothetical protein